MNWKPEKNGESIFQPGKSQVILSRLKKVREFYTKKTGKSTGKVGDIYTI